MADNVLKFKIDIDGNVKEVMATVVSGFEGIVTTVEKTKESIGGFTKSLLKFNMLTQAVQSFSQGLTDLYNPGVQINSALADLSAITGETGEGLKRIEEYARETSKTFGGSAAQAVESYKLVLSQLSPEIAKTPEALKAMGDNIAVLSKTMGGNATAAAEVLTTAMNQYDVSLADPVEASRKMAEMMNVRAAAGKEGSAELPTIKAAVEQSGMAAKSAGISFEELNAAIQVLDKAGKKGAEGGVAIRNAMTILSQGRFLPKDVQAELSAAGVNIDALGDKSKNFSDRLRLLKPVMNDSALFAKLFGRENVNAAMALVQGTEEIDRYRSATTGTNTAVDQAGVIMESFAERQSRINAQFEDMKISLFNATGSFGMWVTTVATALVPITQLLPLLAGVGKLMSFIKAINFAGTLATMSRWVSIVNTNLLYMNRDLLTGQMASLGFLGNITRATMGLVRFATVGIFNAIKGVGALILSLITGGATSITFSAIVSSSFGIFAAAASAACKAVSVAIFSIPIIGWIALAIAAIAGLFIYLYAKVDKFKAVVNGIAAAIKALFTPGESVKDAYNNAYLETLDEAARQRAEEADKEGAKEEGISVQEYLEKNPNARFGITSIEPVNIESSPAGANLPSITGGATSSIGANAAESAGKIKNINITIDKLVDKFTISTTNIQQDVSKVKDMVLEALTSAVNDVNLTV